MAAEGRTHSIGDWRFDAAAGELTRNGERRRLEDRAARTLELLCRHSGEVVGQQAIVDAVWAGRSLSANSVAVVIADLRRALDDDARNPRMIETVPKRGYRLAANEAAVSRPDRRGLMAAVAGGVAVAVVVGAGVLLPRRPRLLLGVGPVANETGAAAYDPLARSVGELTLTGLGRLRGVSLVRGFVGRGEGRRLNLQARLALWSGDPVVYLSAVDAKDGKVVWSGMARGPEDALPANIAAQLQAFEASLGG
jgi:DNA-binding winged helix-turn-helix (wHTH) protein